jgi:hypothetical protein
MINQLSDIVDKIENNIPFAFSRWGDGEWYNVYKHKGQNCDGNIYYEDLGDALLEIVSTKQDYHLGTQTLIQWSAQQAKKFDQDWGDADVMHRASEDGKLQPLIDCLKKKKVVYIGNNSFEKLSFIDTLIEIPYNNIWLQKEDLMNALTDTFDDEHKIYCFSAGMAANVFIHQAWNLDKTNTYLDVGSVFDPYVGRNTRSYHKRIKKGNL